MGKKFDCPACGAPMEYDGESTLFQNCGSCGAPIVVPSSIVERDRDEEIEAVINMPPAKVLEADNMSQVFDHLDKQEVRVEEEKASGEVSDPILVESKKELDNMMFDAGVEDFPADSIEDETATTISHPEIKEKIFSELRAGRKIEAIKIYRDTYNSSLADAKETIEKAFMPFVNQDDTSSNKPAMTGEEVMEQIFRALRGNSKINAIKIYREAYNTSLEDAKEAIEKNFIPNLKQHEFSLEKPSAKTSIEKLTPVLEHLQMGNKLFAIKVFRENFRTGLKEAKDAVDALERGENINISDYA